MDVDFDSRLIVNGGKGNRIGQYLRERSQVYISHHVEWAIWEHMGIFFLHWTVLLSLGITTFQTPVCSRYSLIIPQYLLQRFIDIKHASIAVLKR